MVRAQNTLSPDNWTKLAAAILVPALTDYVGKAAGPDVGSALAAVLK